MTETERLLIEILDRMAARFESHAVLRGGMVLRVLGCERFTNDLDYVMVPFRSKKDVVADVVKTLKELEGVSVTHSLNSKCLRVRIRRGQTNAQVEIKVDQEVPTHILSTKRLAERLGLPPRLIPVLDFPVALADKLAAWNERRLMRDLYDIWFFLRMGVTPDQEHLEKRLQKPSYSKLVPVSRRLTSASVSDFYRFLGEEVSKVTDAKLKEELFDILPEQELAGLAMQFKAEIRTKLNESPPL